MAEHEEELALGESAPEEAPEEETDSVDLTEEGAMTPEGFDLDGWVKGLSPVRRSVTIYAKQHLRAEMDALGERLEASVKGSPKWRELAEQLQSVQEEFEASALDIVVRALDADEHQKLYEAVEKAKSNKMRTVKEIEFTAAHIVEPAGMGVDELHAIHKVLPREVDRITIAAVQADHQSLRGVTAQFRQ